MTVLNYVSNDASQTPQVPQSIVVTSFDESPQLGRLTLRDEGKTIAIGKVLKVKPIA